MTDPEAARKFILAGNATLTLRSTKTQTRYTFKVKQAKNGNLWFVSHMTGPDNESDFESLGIIKSNGEFSLSKKTQHLDELNSAVAG